MRKIETDVLIIGGGLAGLSAALHLDSGLDVMVVCKKTFRECNSARAQGGIACPLAPGDSVESHVRDTLAAGAGLSREKVVREVIVGSFAAIEELEKLGVRFTRDDGQHFYDLGREGGHSHRRILHAGDVTGAELLRVLLKEVASRRNCRLVPGLMAVDLITTGWLGLRGANRCVGAYFLEPKTGDILAVRCDALVLATGGAGKVYLYTSNEDTATGDGIAMAWRCGLPIMNLEFVQFHPTCLFHPEAKSFLISEAVRGEGAVLVTAAGERFMPKYHPRGELAPRDVVARAIDRELKVSGQPCVYLDITHKPESFLRARFPNIYATCLKYGYDMARDRIPVVPAAHYFCGGVEAEADGRTRMPGLYACGETACTGLHGANRLASNSLLEALVCGRKTGCRISRDLHGLRGVRVSIPDWEYGDAVPSDEAIVVEHNWNEVRTCMWDYVGIVRSNKRLERAHRRLLNLRREIRAYYLDYLVTADVLELRNIADVGHLVVRSARMRQESRGLHYNLDHPNPDLAVAGRDTVIEDPPGLHPGA